MVKLLNGKDLSGYIKERQLKEARRLKQSLKIQPRLAIVQCKDDPVINTYVRLKKQYGADMGVFVDDHFVPQHKVDDLLDELNNDDSVHGIIVQLPLEDPADTERIVNLVAPGKDVDALGSKSSYTPATPMAILWLLSGYNVDLAGKSILLIGRGKLVGAPLEKMLKDSDLNVEVIGREAKDLSEHTLAADIIITATGSPAILYANMIKEKAVVVDAGVASEDGKTVGDLHESVYERQDLTVTPAKGGVGPLTVCALFDNVLLAASRSTKS